jgi:hypothetical protein
LDICSVWSVKYQMDHTRVRLKGQTRVALKGQPRPADRAQSEE